MSKIEVDAIEPQSGTSLTLGASGDTITIPSGATLSSTDPLVFPAGTASAPAVTTTDDTNTGIFFPSADTIAFTEGGTEAMRIDSLGSLLVKNTKVAVNSSAINSNGNIISKSPTNGYAALSLLSPSTHSNGLGQSIVALHFCGHNYAQVESKSGVYYRMHCENGDATYADRGQMHFVSGYDGNSDGGQTGIIFTSAGTIKPDTDNVADLGTGSLRWDDVFATNGTIQTSDRNDKQDIEEFSEAEQRVAVACKSLLRKFRWKDVVAEKGENARIHFGIIAQDLQAAFKVEGLDAGRYAMFTLNTWWETYTEFPAIEHKVYDDGTITEGRAAFTRTNVYETESEAPEGAVKKSRMGVRYSELLAFIIAAI